MSEFVVFLVIHGAEGQRLFRHSCEAPAIMEAISEAVQVAGMVAGDDIRTIDALRIPDQQET